MDKYVVFGNPIAQSKSPFIHTLFARQTGQDMCYDAQLVPVDGFKEAAQAFFAAGGRGCNVREFLSIPHVVTMNIGIDKYFLLSFGFFFQFVCPFFISMSFHFNRKHWSRQLNAPNNDE